MEYKSLFKLLVLIVFLSLIQGSIFAQDIQFAVKADSLACDTFPPPRNLDALTFDYTIHLWWQKPEIDTITPKNLIGYKLYLNSDSNDYIPFYGEDTSDYFDTVDTWYPPGTARYHVSAIYDLTECGLPGVIEESSLEGPLDISGLQEAFILDFTEDWDVGSFFPAWWRADEYWYVDGSYGYPPPCATYSNFPDSAYKQELMSWWIDCQNHPVVDTTYIVGDFYLEFEVKLNHLPMSGTDYLDVKIIDSLDWHILEQFSTDSGSFVWEMHTINITEWAKGNITRFNFTAHGEDGANIHDWYVDNISLYRKCNPPLELQWVEFDELLAWSPPLPHSYDTTASNSELQGYRVYYDLTPLAFTTDTFHLIDTPFGYGPYYVVAVYEDCEPASNPIYGPVTIDENDKASEIKIFPNPANEFLFVEAQNEIERIRIFDGNGRLRLDATPRESLYLINSNKLSNGIYFIDVLTEGKHQNRKVIIRH